MVVGRMVLDLVLILNPQSRYSVYTVVQYLLNPLSGGVPYRTVPYRLYVGCRRCRGKETSEGFAMTSSAFRTN